MRTITKDIYEYHELSDAAKAVARDWWREGYEYDAEHVIEDATEVGQRLGITVADEKGITYEGFPGGACFVGNYKFNPHAMRDIKAYAPMDEYLHRLVKQLEDFHTEHGEDVTAIISRIGYHRSLSSDMYCEAYKGEEEYLAGVKPLTAIMRDFADWIYKQMESEYYSDQEDEPVAENIEANEYEFYEDGTHYVFCYHF